MTNQVRGKGHDFPSFVPLVDVPASQDLAAIRAAFFYFEHFGALHIV